LFGVDPGVDPTQRPGGQLPLVAAGLPATLLPPLEQADMAEPSTMVAQMPIAAGTLVMMLASPLLRQPQSPFDGGVRRWRLHNLAELRLVTPG
jgi:hypothetical protein